MIRYIALDPGETTGYAFFDENGELIEFGQFKQSEQNEWLKARVNPLLKAMIVEDYRNFGHMQQKKWSRNQTSKNIGAIEMIADIHNVPVVKQMSNVRAIGYKWANLDQEKCEKNHATSHQWSAVAHGVYYLQLNKIRKPTIPED